MSTVAVLGAGSWGTALAQHLAKNGTRVHLWGRDETTISEINSVATNARYLPGITLSPQIKASTSIVDSVSGASAIVFSVPSSATREVSKELSSLGLGSSLPPVISTAKGIETSSKSLVSEILFEELCIGTPLFVLSGPSFALELAQGLPTAIVLAHGKQMEESEELKKCHNFFHRGTLRVYTSNDIRGVELGGVLKNIVSLAAGISDGLGLGHNARAALLTRSLQELIRLVEAEGGSYKSVIGLSGLGDLVLTATGDLSRNRSFGLLLGKGLSLQDAKAQVGQTIESVTTAQAIFERAKCHNLELPIIEQVAGILESRLTPEQALRELLIREPKKE